MSINVATETNDEIAPNNNLSATIHTNINTVLKANTIANVKPNSFGIPSPTPAPMSLSRALQNPMPKSLSTFVAIEIVLLFFSQATFLT